MKRLLVSFASLLFLVFLGILPLDAAESADLDDSSDGSPASHNSGSDDDYPDGDYSDDYSYSYDYSYDYDYGYDYGYSYGYSYDYSYGYDYSYSYSGSDSSGSDSSGSDSSGSDSSDSGRSDSGQDRISSALFSLLQSTGALELGIRRNTDGAAELFLLSFAGLSYRIETASSLDQAQWSELITLEGNGSTLSHPLGVSGIQRFYRVVVQ